MAAANESQGLKIAVVALITLAVILMVSSYFLFSNGQSAEARLQSAEDAKAVAVKAQNLALNQYDTMRTRVGLTATEFDPAVEEINAHMKKLGERLNVLLEQVDAAVKKAQANGAQGPELEDAKQNVQKAIASLQSEPKKNYISAIDRMSELMDNLSLLTTELALNYVNVRHSLESSTGVAKQQVDVQTKAATDSHADTVAEQKNHEEARATLLTKVDQLQTALDKAQGELLNKQTQLTRQEEDNARKNEQYVNLIREYRDRLERNNETILDRPDGYVTYVDYETKELLISVNRRMGARPQMKMTIFDARSPGIPTEKPKGSIELTSIGETNSHARIIKTDNSIDPIRVGDIVYSPAWSPNQPTKFALVGKMDVNRDGRDDREELKRMIHEAGGVVDYDLPPIDLGKETGVISPELDWYVIDDRKPFRDINTKQSDASLASEAKLSKRVGEITKEARLNGIRPMTIGKLLAYLGYDMSSPIIGRTEVSDPNAMKRLTSQRSTAEGQAKPASPSAKLEGEAAETKKDTDAAETKKDADADEMKKDEPAADDDQPKAKAKAKTATKKAATKKAADADDQ
jgi:hypothetical protein